MSSQLDKIRDVYKQLAKIPSPVSARILKSDADSINVLSVWSQRCLERGKPVKFQRTHLIRSDKTVQELVATESNELLSVYSDSEKLRCVIRETPAVDKTPKKQFLEVWDSCGLRTSLDLTALDIHGDVYTDSEFSSLQWSDCEEKLVYIAEKKKPKSEPFFKTKAQDTLDEQKTAKGDEYAFLETWGEQLENYSQPVVVVANVVTGKLEIVDGLPEGWSPGQVLWAPDGGILGTAWCNSPRRLGLMYCSNRPSVIFHLTSGAVFRKLSAEGMAVRCPRLSPDKSQLVWLERPAGGVHHNAQRLVQYTFPSGKLETVIDITEYCVQISKPSDDHFYGLYNYALPSRCWLGVSSILMLSTPQQTSAKTYRVNTETKTLTQVPLPSGSMGVLDVDPSGRAIVWVSSLTSPPAMYLIGVSRSSPYETLRLTPVIDLPGLDLKIFSDIKAKINNPKANSFTALYVGPRCLDKEQECKDGTIPLIVFPHGGPHVSFGNSFNMDAAFFAQLGFGVLLVNYRGSAGAGAASVESLPGHIGYQDVGDVHQAAIEALECLPELDQTRCLLYGGSHGGFLVLHLSGQYPNLFKAVVSLNPVTNMSAFMGSDIPDWAIVESGFEYTSWEASKEMYDKMLLVSPLQHANAVKAPTLFLLGKKDLRVPSSQGLTFYHALKQRNIETKVLIYDDNHPLSQVPHEVDGKINAVLWFIEHADIKLHIIEH